MRVWASLLVVALAAAVPGSGRAEPVDAPSPPAEVAERGATAALPTITPRQAPDHAGEDVLVEGRVHAVHVSQLATVLAFAPNFAGFTATIHVADLARFPKNIHKTTLDRSVRMRGRIRTYRGRTEMTLSDPSQLVVLDAPEVPKETAPTVSTALAEELRATLARIETRLDDFEHRLAAIEQHPVAPAARERADELVVGMPASAAEAALGAPLEELGDSSGRRVWLYENGRSLTFDASARLVAWSGF